MVMVIDGLLSSCPLEGGNHLGFQRIMDIVNIRLGLSVIWS